MCELLVGLPDVNVIGVADRPDGGVLKRNKQPYADRAVAVQIDEAPAPT